ncbi:MAG: acylphosphatase [Myxococcota bacterium]
MSARAIVSGRVQGVWFRAATQERALQLGVTGWVKNRPDGRVEALFEGEPEAVERALAFVAEGPRLARVTGVEIERGDATGGFTGFEVRR